MVERLICNQRVGGPNPSTSSMVRAREHVKIILGADVSGARTMAKLAVTNGHRLRPDLIIKGTGVLKCRAEDSV